MKIAVEGMIAIRDSVHTIQEGLYDLEARMGYMNQTVKDHAQSFSLLANTHFFMSNIRSELIEIDVQAGNKRVSGRILKLTNERLWKEGDEEFG